MILALLNSIRKGWVQEYQFHPERKWRADVKHPDVENRFFDDSPILSQRSALQQLPGGTENKTDLISL